MAGSDSEEDGGGSQHEEDDQEQEEQEPDSDGPDNDDDDDPAGTTTDADGLGDSDDEEEEEDNDDDDIDDDEDDDEDDEGLPSASAASSRANLEDDDDDAEEEDNDGDADDEEDDAEEDGEESDDDVDDGDRKPAAKSSDNDDDDDDDDDGEESSSEEEGSSSSDDEPDFVTMTDEHGVERRVSAYEAMRIERIRRNRERLASLGLEGSSKGGRKSGGGGGTLLSGHQEELERQRAERREKLRQRRKERESIPESERRSSSRKRNVVSYVEQREPGGRASSAGGSTTSGEGSGRGRGRPPKSPKEDRQKRVPLFIFREFRRMESERKQNLKRAEKNSRAAELEYRLAKRAAEKVQKAQRRREEEENRRRTWQERQQERKELQEFFRSIDDRRTELFQARSSFDQIRAADMQRRSRNFLDHRRAYVDAMTRYPLAVDESAKHLDMLLMQRCPNDIMALSDMGASLSTPSASSSGLKRKKKKKKRDKGTGEGKEKGKKKRKINKEGGGSMAAAASPYAATTGFGTPGTPAYPYGVGATPGPSPALIMGAGMPFATPSTGSLHPTAARQVYAAQERAMKNAIAQLAASSLVGNPTTAAMLAPNASGYPNLTGGAPRLPQIAAKASKSKSKNAPKGKKKGGESAVIKEDTGKSAKKGGKESKGAKPKERKLRRMRAKNVGGPIPGLYAKVIQRQWLDIDDAFIPSSSKQFIPQTGDLVLYYPQGHKLFLETHTDHLGKKLKQQMRQPLWERAKKEREGPSKKGKGETAGGDGDGKPAATTSSAPAEGAEEKSAAKSSPKKRSRKASKKVEDQGEAVDESSEVNSKPLEGDNVEDGKNGQPKKAKKGPVISPPWYNEEWLASMETDEGGAYPILCRVEGTQAEFPYNKGAVDIATNRKTSWSGHVDKAKKEQIKEQLSKRRPMLRLAVTLKPLTPVVPPTLGEIDDDNDADNDTDIKKGRLAPPPAFTAICFPSKHHQPFILPFFWTFRQSFSLVAGDKLQMQFDDDIYTGEFERLADESVSLENAFARFPEIFAEDDKMPLDRRLEQLLVLASAEKSASIPFEDVRAILQFISYYWHKQNGAKNDSQAIEADALTTNKDGQNGSDAKIASKDVSMPSGEPAAPNLSYGTLVDFICSVLPRWDNAVVKWDDKSVTVVCPWEVVLLDEKKVSASYPGCRPGNLVSTLGGKLLEDTILSIQGYIEENPEAAKLLAPVDVKTSPKYQQAVPLAMSVERILARLEHQPLKVVSTMTSAESATSHKCSYYRSVSAIIEDLTHIAHNCVLYSDSGSDTVMLVRNAVEDLKSIVENIEARNQRKMKLIEKKRESGQLLLWQTPFRESSRKERDPFVSPMRRMWAQEMIPDRSWGKDIAPRLTVATSNPSGLVSSQDNPAAASAASDSMSQELAIAEPTTEVDQQVPKTLDINAWMPQAGDEVFYSLKDHAAYLRSHFNDLAENQRNLPPLFASVHVSTASASAWFAGTISSVSAVFPAPPPEDDTTRTLDDLTPILKIGIHFNYPWLSQKTHFIHWRPCQVHGRDPVLKPPKKKTKKPTFRPIRVKALVKKKDVMPGRQLYFKPLAMKKNPRLARALGIKKQAVRIRIKVNDREVGPPTKRTKIPFIDRKQFEENEELSEALFGEDATQPCLISVRVDGKKVANKPMMIPPYIMDNVDGLADAIDNAGIGEYKSMSVFVTVNDQKILRKPIVLPPYVLENISGLADAIGSKRRENDDDPNTDDEADNVLVKGAKSLKEETQLIGETPSGQCKSCGLTSEAPFLRPAWIETSKYLILTPMQPLPRFTSPQGLESSSLSSILHLLNILKRRALSGIAFDSFQNEDFDNATSIPERSSGTGSASLQTIMSNMPARERETLAKFHYLPPWFSETSNDEVSPGIRKSDAFLPLPYLCLDLVQRRLQQGYYRNLIGATHDIREAYVVTVMYLLSSEGIESLKKIAVLLAQRSLPPSSSSTATAALPSATSDSGAGSKKKKKRKRTNETSTDTTLFGVKVTLKEAAIIKRIEKVRRLYAAALTCCTHTIVVETALGKKREGPSVERVTVNDLISDRRQMATRKKITHLIGLINADPCRFRRPIRGHLGTNPSVRIKVTVADSDINADDDGKLLDGDGKADDSMEVDNTDQPKSKADTSTATNDEKNSPAASKDDEKAGGNGHIMEVDNTDQPNGEAVTATATDDKKIPPAASKDVETADGNGSNSESVAAASAPAPAPAPAPAGEDTGTDNIVDGEGAVEDEPIDLSVPLVMNPVDYLSDADLVRALFGRENRKFACVRCQKAGRSMFACRVTRAHSAADFDLDEVLGERGIDGLISDLLTKPNLPPISALLASPDDTDQDDSNAGAAAAAAGTDEANDEKCQSKKSNDKEESGGDPESKDDSTAGDSGSKGNNESDKTSNNNEGDAADSANDKGTATAASTATSDKAVPENGESESKESESTNDAPTTSHALTESERIAKEIAAKELAREKAVLESFEKARLAVQLSRETLSTANKAMSTPPALSQEFIQMYYPIDAIDGHYEICTVCGLGGDIMCCETCPNVSHTSCAGLTEVPEGDWYCKLCVAKGKGPKPGTDDGDNSQKKTVTVADQAADAPKKVDGETPEVDAAEKSDKSKDTDASTKKVSFEQEPPVIGNSASTTTSEAQAPTATSTENSTSFEEKMARLETIVKELKSLRQKPKPGAEDKQEEEKKIDDNEQTVNDSQDGDIEGKSDDEDDDDTTSPKKKRAKPSKKTSRQRDRIALGTKILKDFEGYGDFEGQIEALPDSEDEGKPFYRVRYIDGDEEDMSENEAHECHEYWKEKNAAANKEPDDPNVRKRRRPKRFETTVESSARKRAPQPRAAGTASANSSRPVCKVEDCSKFSQQNPERMCASHYSKFKKGELEEAAKPTPSRRGRGRPRKSRT